MNIMLDTNVIIDYIAVRQPWYLDVEQIWNRVLSGSDQGYVSASALTDIYYITSRILEARPFNSKQRMLYSQLLRVCISLYGFVFPVVYDTTETTLGRRFVWFISTSPFNLKRWLIFL